MKYVLALDVEQAYSGNQKIGAETIYNVVAWIAVVVLVGLTLALGTITLRDILGR